MFLRERFNDTLALVMLIGVPVLWIASSWLTLPGEVVGATIAGWMLVVQFYFRRREPSEPEPPPQQSKE